MSRTIKKELSNEAKNISHQINAINLNRSLYKAGIPLEQFFGNGQHATLSHLFFACSTSPSHASHATTRCLALPQWNRTFTTNFEIRLRRNGFPLRPDFVTATLTVHVSKFVHAHICTWYVWNIEMKIVFHN